MATTTTATTKTSLSASDQDALDHIKDIVPPTELITPDDPDYVPNSQPWSVSKDLKPRLVVRPTTIETLSKVIAYLNTTDLDFKVRSHGFGSASAKDVLITLTSFDGFDLDLDDMILTLGAGGNWGRYYERMENIAPNYTIVAARTSWIGIGGSTLCSGFSWLSGEYGCVSDPENMLDAQVVLLDGTVKWASEDPDLLWALRGSECGFAIVTAFKFRVRPFPEQGKIWSGSIMLPRNKVKEVAKGIAYMCREENINPKVAMFLYVVRREQLSFINADVDMLVIHAYDALGEEHGRREFAWALEMEGAVDLTRGNMTMKQVSDLQANIGELRGTSASYWSPLALSTISEQTILNSFAWWNELVSLPNSVSKYPYVLFELSSCRDNLAGPHGSAWLRPAGYKHMLLLGAGCAPEAGKEEHETAVNYLKTGPEMILGTKEFDLVPNSMEEFHDKKRIYKGHYEKLQQIKQQYDPENKLKGPIIP